MEVELNQNDFAKTTQLDQPEPDIVEQKWQNQLEIPNIEDPLLFIDTLYNQLLANNIVDNKEEYAFISKEATERNIIEKNNVDLNSICSSHNTSSSSSLSDSCLHMQFELMAEEKLADVPDSTLNEGQLSCCASVNNDLSLIDYSYLIANHGSENHDQLIKESDQGVQDYAKMIPNLVDWNYEDEASDFNDLSINYEEFIRNKLPDRKVCQVSIEENHEPLITSTQKIFDKGKLVVEESKKPPELSNLLLQSLSKSIQFPVVFPLSPSVSSPSLSTSSISTSISPFNFTINKLLRSNRNNFYSCISLHSSFDSSPSFASFESASVSNTRQKEVRPEGKLKKIEKQVSNRIGKLDDQLVCTTVDLIPERSDGYMKSFFNSVFNSFKYLMTTRNIVLLPIFLILLNSRFKSVGGGGSSLIIHNSLRKISKSAALIALSSITKNE
jgi:hypothetical protein